MRRALPTLLAFTLVLVACAGRSGQASDEASGTIVGKVLLGPTCPVQRFPSPCPPRPLPHVLVQVVDANGDVLADATSDDAGSFELTVRPGSYLLTASIEEDPVQSVKPTRVRVASGSVVHANVLVDSGIR